MKLKIALLSTAFICVFTMVAKAETVRIGIATEPYPPFTYPDASGHYEGWEVDIAKASCAEAKLDCKVVATAFDSMIPALLAKKIDVIVASLSINEERQKVIDFSDKYYQTGTALMVSQDSDIKPTPSGVEGRTVAVQSGSVHQAYALKHFPKAKIREYQTQDEANQDLFAGRVDATLADAVLLDEYLKSEDGKLCCKNAGLVAEDVDIQGKGIGFGIRKENTELKTKLNKAIKAIRANGTYAKINSKYFTFDIYGD